jgi:DNA-binding CsgD family transcriptional regulator
MDHLPHAALADALDTLLSPLHAERGDGWRAAVCRRLRALTGTEIGFFRISNGGPTLIDPAGPLLERELYRREFRPLDPWPRCSLRSGEGRIDTHENLLGSDRIRRDPYYNEFLLPCGIRDHIGIQIGTKPGEHVHLGLYNSGRSKGMERVEENVKRLRTVLPAFQSGLRAWQLARTGAGELGAMLDRLGEAVALYGEDGGLLHANAALREAMVRDPGEESLRAALDSVARDFARCAGEGLEGRLEGIAAHTVVTPLGAYRIRPVRSGSLTLPRAGTLLLVDPPVRKSLEDDVLIERFRLRPREIEVARLLARGLDNAAIARELGMRETTARNHTARVLRKLAITSRASVSAILHP